MSRRAAKDFTACDFNISKGNYCDIMLAYTSLNEKYFKNPDTFDINRWNNKEILKDPFTFIPFSAGGRNCIGKHLALIEAKVFLSFILLNFKLKLKNKPFSGFTVGMLYEFKDANLVDFEKKIK